ncbi:hypothetical protein [Flagellimonas onchidii]|uniref:hypothetical protein n=1 Tax=Flagellimonas onchidii TaxID=2562684 RepID=UPI0010A667B7|nr:hypothetical protein [Allomuricauda onchidii]
MYNNGTEFSFFKAVGDKLGDALQRLNSILFGVVEAKQNTFNWDYIILEYNERCAGGDLDEFCSCYVTGYSMMFDFSHDKVAQEAMYLELRAHLLVKRIKGEVK